MAQFIPNQPITFGNVAQPCLNSDNRAYAMLMQGEEKWKLQIDNTPCGNPDGSLCDVNMNRIGNYLVNSEFTTATEWTAVDAFINETAGFAQLYVDSSSANEGTLTKLVGTSLYCGTYTELKTYKLSFEITGISNQAGSTFFINSLGGGNTYKLYNGTPYLGITELYVQAPATFDTIQLGLVGTNGDIVRINFIKMQEIAGCWSTFGNGNGLNGALALSQNAWQYGIIGNQGFYTAIPNWDVYIPATFPVNTLTVCTLSPIPIGDTIELTYTISGRTAGEIYPVLGTNSGSIRNTNGTFTEYITADIIAYDLQFWTDADFDGTISIVSGKIYANCHTFDVIDANTGNVAANEFVPNYIGNKIEMVFNPRSIPGTTGGEPNDFDLATGCYQIRFNDCCTGESYLSDTVINYTRGEHDCTVLVDATCDDQAFGFDFSNEFSLSQRLRLLRFNPIYKNEGEDSQGSDGVKRRPFARSEKVYNCIFDYCDEPTHDAINTQLLCDNLTLDGVEYFCPIKDYQPEWSDRGKLNLAQSQVELQKKQSVIYNRNCI